MYLDKHILHQFIGPDHTNRQEVEKIIQEITTQLLDFLSRASAGPTIPDFQYIDREHFQIPDRAQTLSHISENLQQLYKLSMNPANPRYIGHMDSMPTLWSVIGDFIASGLNNNLLSLEMSPFITQMEYSLTKQFADLFGFRETGGGIILNGGTLSNMQALLVARNKKLNISNGNVSSLNGEPVMFASEHAHASIKKISMMMGIGTENVIAVRTDKDSKMDVEDLELQIRTQLDLGKLPFAVIATAGTTVSGNIDPLKKISELAVKYDLWLHIDAIYGGALIFSGKYKYLIEGIELADSIAFNPQKWMYISKTCSMVLFKDFNSMVSNFRTAAPYMRKQSSYVNLGEISIQGSKQAEVIKLWLSLLSLGKNGYQQLIDYGFYLKEKFELEVQHRPYLKLAGKTEMNILCFRGEPPYLKATELDAWNEKMQYYLLQKSNFFLSLPTYRNGLWLRAVLLNPFLKDRDIELLFEHMDKYEQTTQQKNC